MHGTVPGTARQPGWRQTMSWLHTWGGLVCGWLLCAIFVTGTLSVFREPITRWMQAAPANGPPGAALGLQDRLQALHTAEDYLQQRAPQARQWQIDLPARAGDALQLSARGPDGVLQAALDPASGAPQALPPIRQTEGGRHFMSFHYSLQGGLAGFWVVGVVSMGMMAALVSGLIVHRRIFQDFFCFRPGKGQRSWLDAHNASAVLTLPFLFMIVYTGLAYFYTSYMPHALQSLYGVDRQAYSRYQTDLNAGTQAPRPDLPPAGPQLAQQLQLAQSLLRQPVASIALQHPPQGPASHRFTAQLADSADSRRMHNLAEHVSIAADTGEVLQAPPRSEPAASARDVHPVIEALHMARFGGWTMKWLYFVCGLAGTAMVATGLLLFASKRRTRSDHGWGRATPAVYRCIDALNIAALAGTSLASIGYLYGNRLLPLAIEARASAEIRLFFALWALSLLHALLRPARSAWQEQLCALALLCMALPLLNAATTGQHLLLYLDQADGLRAGVELTSIALGLLAAWGAWRHRLSTHTTPPARAARPGPRQGARA
ncbi:PepSY-associated TM helix domain-containing protein [Comamonas sp.]|uniref:PepSY-associated TM helix domain-containing protein n=1 Tax=Comamonas sp. TaxID=34028 RepID=UPI002896A6BC|nr:PepSY-associated TM helix domain-containing protein [Comamonas sp.]